LIRQWLSTAIVIAIENFQAGSQGRSKNKNQGADDGWAFSIRVGLKNRMPLTSEIWFFRVPVL
jgi:hypothetical protein